MNLQKPHFRPDPGLSREEMEKKQRNIAREAVFEGSIEPADNPVVAGVDQAFHGEKAVSGIVVLKDGEVVEKVHGKSALEVAYVPGLLAFREGPPIIEALGKLETEPDLLVLDGSGRIHFREAGIATHIGVLFEIPSVGVAKNLLCGDPVREVDKLEEGESVRIVADESVETSENATLGYAYQSRQHNDSYRINPLYVSPGHRFSPEKAVEIVESCCSQYKLPEPTRLADNYVDDLKGDFQ